MNEEKLNDIGELFWGVIALLMSFSIAFCLYKEQQYSLLILAIGPIFGFWRQYTSVRKGRIKKHYYPKNLMEYVVENSLIFLLFLFCLFYLEDYPSIQIISLLIMLAVWIFNTYSMGKFYNKTENV